VLARFRPRATYANVISTIAIVLAVGTGGAYAADTIGSSDVIDESLLSQDIKNGQVTAVDMKTSAVVSRTVLDGSLTGRDIANFTLTSSDVGEREISGFHVREETLSVRDMGCQRGKINGFARIKGASTIPSSYTTLTTAIDQSDNCSGGDPSVRRASTGVYYVLFPSNSSRIALAGSNSDDQGPNSSRTDNIVSVAKLDCATCADRGAFRVEVEDATASGTGSIETDGWFTIMVM
jgi:hypothetical protein